MRDCSLNKEFSIVYEVIPLHSNEYFPSLLAVIHLQVGLGFYAIYNCFYFLSRSFVPIIVLGRLPCISEKGNFPPFLRLLFKQFICLNLQVLIQSLVLLWVYVNYNQQFQVAVKNGPLNPLARNKCEMQDRNTIKLVYFTMQAKKVIPEKKKSKDQQTGKCPGDTK